MNRSRFAEAQIIGSLRENEVGASAGELARKRGVSEGAIAARPVAHLRSTSTVRQALRQTVEADIDGCIVQPETLGDFEGERKWGAVREARVNAPLGLVRMASCPRTTGRFKAEGQAVTSDA